MLSSWLFSIGNRPEKKRHALLAYVQQDRAQRLEAAEALYIEMRQGYKQLGGIKSVETWIRSTENYMSRELYRILVMLPCKGFIRDEHNDIKWLAVQKA